ncbi:MAG: hypothetical protein EXR93_05930 [Gemmatimonadetes bacterium]|nr:hypothetical protein [Gemmatimonadota bacterium]
MFIELTDLLRCAGDHADGHLVVATGEMRNRRITRGMIGCPVCNAEYWVEKGVARFGATDRTEMTDDADRTAAAPDAAAIHAFLGLGGPGGYVALVGTATRAAHALGQLLGDVHLVGINAPDGVFPDTMFSLLESPGFIPLRTASVRGVVVGGERANEKWLSEAARVVLPGQRIVVLSDKGEAPGIERMASGPGVWVGVKRETGKGKGEK